MIEIAPSDLHELLEYDPHTGGLVWKRRGARWFVGTESKMNAWNSRNAGKAAFITEGNGRYYSGTIKGRHYKAHRVVWALVHGAWPSKSIDHINGDGRDNRIENLREVTHAQNMRNRISSRKSASGHRGVYVRRGRYRVTSNVMGKTVSIGTFDRLEDALDARRAFDANGGFTTRHLSSGC